MSISASQPSDGLRAYFTCKGYYLEADKIIGSPNSTAYATGKARLSSADYEVNADEITYSFQNGSFSATGSVHGSYRHPTYGQVVFTAETVTGNVMSGDIEAKGQPHIQTSQGSLTCSTLTYNTRTGRFTAEGKIQVQYYDTNNEKLCLTADKLEGCVGTSEVKASGHVSVIGESNSLTCDEVQYNLESHQFEAFGNTNIIYWLPTNQNITLTANKVTGNFNRGTIEASENIFLKQGNGRTFTGDNLSYNLRTDEGIIRNASALIDGIYFRGKELVAEGKHYIIKESRFTTCDKEDKPHYYLSAKELVIEPENRLVVRHASIHLLGSTLIKIPKYTLNLQESSEKKIKLPTIGVNTFYGPYASYEFDISNQPSTVGGLALRISERQAVQGGILYDRIADQPVFFRFTYREPFYSGDRPNILLSRLPEIGIKFCSGPSSKPYILSREYADLAGETISPTVSSAKEKKLNIVSVLGIGRFREEPSYTKASRIDARTVIWLEPIPLEEKIVFSPGLSVRFSSYESKNTYTVVTLRLATLWKLGAEAFGSLSYIVNNIKGNTPFDFDRVELKQELVSRIVFPVGTLKVDLASRYDLRNNDVYDTQVTISQKLHCLEPKITWHSRFHEFTAGLSIVGF
jgi:lipopolysaccharide export system protein LptA